MHTDAWPDWKVTKLDAARRQLETAIRLLFEQVDAVSVHTLAHASFGILKDVAKHRNEQRVLSAAEKLASKGENGDFWRGFNRTGNFFKHGDKDPEEILSGTPEEENEALISLAIELYRDLGCQFTPTIESFDFWWRCIHFEGIHNVREPFISWLNRNAPRLHSNERHELLALGHDLLRTVEGAEVQ
jgi:hypothetical protein